METFQTLADKLCHSLEISERGHDVASDMVRQSVEKQVEYAFILINVSAPFRGYQVVRGLKNENESIRYKNEGDEAFEQENFVSAIHYYTSCIIWLPKNSSLLPLAYASRSESLFQLKRFYPSLCDTNRALNGDNVLPDRVKSNLRLQKKICIAELKKAKSSKTANKNEILVTCDELYESITNPDNTDKFSMPIIERRSESIPNASQKVNVMFTKDHDRHLVATEDIEPGEILLIERPFASVLLPHFNRLLCTYCYVRCEALIPCPECLLGTYCSESCRSKAFDEFHRIECPILFSMKKLEVTADMYLTLRLLLITTKQGANLECIMDHSALKSFANVDSGLVEGQCVIDDFNGLQNLMHHHAKLTSVQLFHKLYKASILLFLLKHTTFFGWTEEERLKMVVNKWALAKEEISVAVFFLKFLSVSACNKRPLEDVLKTRKEDDVEETYHKNLIGYAVYHLHSLMNHSCDPNSVSINHKDSVVCYAAQPIKKGEQIFSNYHWNYLYYDKEFRKNQLRAEYFFNCHCRACELNWAQKLSYADCKPKRTSDVITEEEIDRYEKKFELFTSAERGSTTLQEDLTFLCKLINFYYENTQLPNCTFIEAKERLSLILAEFGNIYKHTEDLVLCELASLEQNDECV